ncbi:hypothetical protein LCGC14_2969300, partial [marine sediment metagenome]
LTDVGVGVFTITRLVPTFGSNITGLPSLSFPTVRAVRSDETVLLRDADGSLSVRILIEIEAPSSVLTGISGIQARYRVNDSSGDVFFWELTSVQDILQGYIEVMPVEELEIYDYQCRFVNNDNTKGPWSTIAQHTVIGKSSPPSDVTNFISASNRGILTLIWTQVLDLDIAGYVIRFHKQGTPDWGNGDLLTDVARITRFTTDTIPPGDWTFLIRAIDTSGNLSTNTSSVNDTIIQNNVVVSEVEHSPIWAGTLTNFVRHVTGKLIPQGTKLVKDYLVKANFEKYCPDAFATSIFTIFNSIFFLLHVLNLKLL